ncbi:hypothetical protein KAJ27_11650, partial [bacterium]|nr:hypothetical protein [bacterium]
TIGKLFNVTVFSENKKLDPEIAQRVFKNEVLTDNIDKNMSNIKVNGSLMKIGDISLTSGNLIVYRGKSKVGKLKVDKNNQSLLQESGIEMILPAGRYMIEADGVTENIDSKITTTEKLLYTQELNVIKDDFIFVAMFDAEMGHNTFEGNIEPIQHDRRYRDKYWKDGRAAFYLKGKIKGKYLVTSSYDSERSRRDLFRKLDPDTYYPVYGDYSSTSYDATNTQGKLYFMVEWDKSKALFGNFSADLSGSKLAPYSKSFYGGKLDYQSVATSPWGDPLTRIVIYKATQNQRSAHNEFLATGGSLYFLKHRNLINGSLRISIEVRDKLTGLVITKKSQTEGMDFNVDYGNGRILFFQPVRSRVMSNILTTNQLLDGNPVYVIAEYEFDDLYTFKEGSVGGRIEQGVGEYVNVGGSYVKEEQGNRDYELKEADATVRFGKLASIRGEYAETQSSAMDMFLSDDGGLSFASISLNDNSKGRAYIFEGNILLGQKGIISAYHQNTGAGFSTSSTINQQGKKSTGMALTYNYNTMLNLSLRHDIQEIISNTNAIATAQLGATKSTTSIIQIGGQKGKITYTGEYRRQQVQTPLTGISTEANRPQQLFAVQLDYKISEQYSAFLKQQGVISGTGENMTSLGVKAQINDKTSIQLAHTIAEESNATSVDVGYSPYNWLQLTGNVARTDHRLQSMSNDSISLGATGNVYDKLQLRTTYALQKSGDGISRNGVSVGSSYQVSPETMLTVDRAWLSGSGEKSISNIYGLSGKINERLAGNISYEDGLVLRLDGTTSNRKAGSIGFTFVNDNDGDGENDFTASGKAEMRKDNSATGTAKHILLLGTLQGRINQNTTVFAKASIANAELPDQNTFEADYREYVLGVAYRPEFSDKLNLLSRYTYLKDNSPSSQSDYTELEEEKGHVFALEAIYDFSPKLQLMEKFAYRLGEEKTAGFDFTKSQTSLWINRLQYNFNDNWSVATEYRILQQKQADDSKMGALMEVIRKIGEDFNVGLGYNFTDFNDNLTHLDYTVKGPFVRFTGVFTDKYFKPRAKVRRYQSNTKTDKKKIEIAGNQSIVSTNKNIDENKQIFKDIEAVDNKIIMMLTAELDKKKPKKKSLWQTLVSAGNYVKNNELDKASTQYLRAIELSKKSGDKLITAEIYKQLGLVFQAKGDNRQSLIAFRIALVTFEKKLGGDNPAVAEVLSFIAFGYGKSGHDYLARASLRHSIRIMTMNYGENDPRVGACVNRLAWLHCYQGDYKAGF